MAVDGADMRGVLGGGQRGEFVLLQGAQQVGAGGLEVGGRVEVGGAVGEHLALHLQDRARIGAAALQQTQHGGQHRPTDGRRRVGGQTPRTHPVDGRGANSRPVGPQIVERDQPALAEHMVGDPGTEFSAVEQVETLVGERLQRVGQGDVGQQLSDGDRPVSVEMGGPGLGVEAVEALAGQLDVTRGRGAEAETTPGDVDGRGGDVGPRGAAVARVGFLERLERARRRRRAGTGVNGDATAVLQVHLAQPTAEALGRQAASGHLAVAVDDGRIAVSGPDVDERARQRRHDAGLADVGGEHRGDCGVDGVAAEVDEVEPGLRGEGVGCGDRTAVSAEELVLGHQKSLDSTSSMPRRAS